MIKKKYIVSALIASLVIVLAVGFSVNNFRSQKNKAESVCSTTNTTATTKTLLSEKTTEQSSSNLTSVLTITTKTPTTHQKITETKTTSVKTTNSIKEVSKYKANTEDDLFYLAAAVCREAGGSSEEIQLLVANVIINRVDSSVYPNTIYGVLTQRKQYGTMWKHGISFPDWANQEIKDRCYSVAQRILGGERVCPKNVLYQAEFKQGSGIYKHIDKFYFCYY